MSRVQALGLALAASLTMLVAACGGDSDNGAPELAFVSTRDGDYALFGMSADGGDQERLSDEKGDPSSPQGLLFQIEPAWSPDGSRIAFASKREGSLDVYSMLPDGDDVRQLTTSGADESHPTWSASGTLVAFTRGTPGDIYVVGADGSDERALVTDPADDSQPTWSPDGAWIAFVRREPGTPIRELWVVRPNGKNARRLTALEAVSEAPAWSPDSKRIAFSTNARNVEFEIYVVGVDGRGARRLTVSDEDSFEPAWSPDGATIAYSEGGAIYTKAASAEPFDEGERLTDPANNDLTPQWRPLVQNEP